MNQNTVTGDYININLRQLGATSIKEFNSIMHIAEFDLGDGLIVSYVLYQIAIFQLHSLVMFWVLPLRLGAFSYKVVLFVAKSKQQISYKQHQNMHSSPLV